MDQLGQSDKGNHEGIVEDSEFVEKVKSIFSREKRTWVEYVEAEEEVVKEKTARLRAARLARALQ